MGGWGGSRYALAFTVILF